MAICMVFSPPKDAYSKDVYDKIMEHLGDSFPPPSMSSHAMGHTDEGEIRIVDIFESAEAFQEFAASHAPVYEAMGVDLDEILQYVTIFEVERLIQ